MRGFYNDDDGLSITDTLALGFSGVYALVVVVLLVLLVKGQLAEIHVDFLSVCSWPVLSILAGYFGDRVASRFGRFARSRKVPPREPDVIPPAPADFDPKI
jgi:hypothetical protein